MICEDLEIMVNERRNNSESNKGTPVKIIYVPKIKKIQHGAAISDSLYGGSTDEHQLKRVKKSKLQTLFDELASYQQFALANTLDDNNLLSHIDDWNACRYHFSTLANEDKTLSNIHSLIQRT